MRRRWVRILISVALLAAFVAVGRRYFDKLHLLLEPSPFLLAALVAVYVVTRALNGEVLRVALRPLGRNVGRGECFMLTMVMSYTNLLVPHAGLGAPAMYLKRKYALRYSDFAAVLMPMMVLQLICAGVAGLAGSAVLGARSGWEKLVPLMVLFAAAIAGGTAAVFLKVPVPARWKGRLPDAFRRFSASWRLLRTRGGLVRSIVLLHLVVILLRAVRLEVAFAAVGHGGHFVEVFVASICAQFMLLISLTPAALGFREAAVVAVYEHLVGDPAVAMAAALLDRIVTVVVLVLLAQVGLWRYVRPAIAGGGKGPTDEPDDE